AAWCIAAHRERQPFPTRRSSDLLSHELETLVMAVDNGTIGAEPAVFDLIQASLDELARMREQVVNGRPVAPPRAMIASLQDLSRSEEHTSELQSPYALVCRPLLE